MGQHQVYKLAAVTCDRVMCAALCRRCLKVLTVILPKAVSMLDPINPRFLRTLLKCPHLKYLTLFRSGKSISRYHTVQAHESTAYTGITVESRGCQISQRSGFPRGWPHRSAAYNPTISTTPCHAASSSPARTTPEHIRQFQRTSSGQRAHRSPRWWSLPTSEVPQSWRPYRAHPRPCRPPKHRRYLAQSQSLLHRRCQKS